MVNYALIELNERELKLSLFQSINGKYRLLEERSQPFKLGEEICQEELLRPKTKQDLVEVLKIYRRMIEIYKVEKIFAVASNILCKARNYHGFIDEIYNNTGISMEILSDDDVIKYVYDSTVASVDYSKGYLINIGAYSTNFVKYNRRTILASYTIPIGACKVSEDDASYSIDQLCEIATKHIEGIDLVSSIEEEAAFVGSGKAFISFGHIAKKIARYPLDLDNNYVVSKEVMDKTCDFIKGVELDRLKKIKGIEEAEAACIANELAIIKAFYNVLGAKEVTVTTASVRDGIMHANVALPSQEKFNDLLNNSLESYIAFHKNDHSINANVYSMALILFKQLKVMHKLPRYYVKPLRIAAMLYDSGKIINIDDYMKHGFEAILYSGIAGASHRELLIAAFTCVCQDLDNFSLAEWTKYKDILTEEDLDAVRKMGVIVKLADALNASKKPIITDIICDILGDSIIMKTVVEGDASFEIMEGMKVAVDYKRVFKKSLQII